MAHKNRKYPHLLPESIAVWERWLAIHRHEYLLFDYDVRVGEGRDPGPTYEDNIRQDGKLLSMRRIDAVGHRSGSLTIIEITPTAGIKCLGQIMAYPVLYRQTYHPTKPLRTLIVAEHLGTDVLPALRSHQINYNLV